MTDTVEDAGHVVLLTGMSGAGKGVAARIFEDMGWQVVDNLPPALIASAVQARSGPLCMVCDVRSGDVGAIGSALALAGKSVRTLYLDASDDELVRRFKETRRPHPLFSTAGGILPAIAAERSMLSELRALAHICLDTTSLPPAGLRQMLRERFSPQSIAAPIQVTVASFGFKHGIPLDADLVFDVRFLRNPYYDSELRDRDGCDDGVDAFVMEDPRAQGVLDRLLSLLDWSLPYYISEGKAYLTVAIGCTGGKHRSVVVARRIGDVLSRGGYRVRIEHRDRERPR